MARKINKKKVLNEIKYIEVSKNCFTEELKIERAPGIDQMLNGKLISKGGRFDELLENASQYIEKDSKILTLPELILARTLVDYTHKYWNSQILTNSEQNIGIDYEGRYYKKGEEILVTIHGGGLVTQEKLTKAYDVRESISVVHSQEEFSRMLNGIDESGNTFPMYTYEEIKENGRIESLYHKHGCVIPYELVKSSEEWTCDKQKYLKNPLLIGFIGSKTVADSYYDHCQKHHKKQRKSDDLWMYCNCQELIKDYFNDGERKPRGLMLRSGYNNLLTAALAPSCYSYMCNVVVVETSECSK